MPSSQGSQVQTSVIELSENLSLSNETMPKENLSLCNLFFFSLFYFRASHIPWDSKL
jgi:hypothetical protein